MALFGGRAGSFIKNIWQGAGDLIDDVGDIIPQAPGAVRDFSDQLADMIFGGAQNVQQAAGDSEFARDLEREAIEFRSRQAGDVVGQQAGNLLNNPNFPILILGVGAIILAAIFFKDN